MDPVGVGARSLSECIVLQLSQLDESVRGLQSAIRIANEHLDLVGSQQYAEIRRALRGRRSLIGVHFRMQNRSTVAPLQSNQFRR
jgi:DNA-directed RNA polymerase specialized sigma54-like protein